MTSYSVPQQSSSVIVSCGANHIWISSSVYAWITGVTDGQTDGRTDVIAIAIAAFNTLDACHKLGHHDLLNVNPLAVCSFHNPWVMLFGGVIPVQLAVSSFQRLRVSASCDEISVRVA